MTQPISDLTATWTNGIGIQLNWTAAPDATNGSQYEIYVLQNVLTYTPMWNLVGTSMPLTSPDGSPLSAQTTALGVFPPATDYLYPLSAMTALFSTGGVAPNSLAFSVIHRLKSTGVASTAVSVSAYKGAVNVDYGTPHFNNNITLDSFGQFNTSAQDSYAEIANSVGMFLGTIKGQRSVVPDYGIDDLPMNMLDVSQIQSDLNKAEDRAEALVSVSYDGSNNATLNVRVQAGQGGTQ